MTWANNEIEGLSDSIRYIISHFLSNLLLTQWGRLTHICVSKLTIVGSDNGLSPGLWQAIIWTNAGILLIGLLPTNFSEILIEIHTFLFKKMHLNRSSEKLRPFCLGLDVLNIFKKCNKLWYGNGRNERNRGNGRNTVKPVCNDHLYNKTYYLWSIH